MQLKFTKKYYIFFILLLVLFVIAFNYSGLYFLADDFIHIPQSAALQMVQQNALRPVGNLSLWLNYIISKENVWSYFLTNLCLHVACTSLVYNITKRLTADFDNKHLPLLAALFFLFYPYHAEVSFWIIARSASLGTLFFLLAWLPLLHQNNTVKDFVSSLFFFQLGLLSYESVWIFPAVVMLSFWLQQKTTTKYKWFSSATVFLFVINIAVRKKILGELLNEYDARLFIDVHWQNLAANFFRLLGRSFVPPFYHSTYFVIATFIALIIIFALILLSVIKQKQHQLIIFLSVTWLLSYLPYLSIGIDTHGTEAERYLYLPSIFLTMLLVVCLDRLFTCKVVVSIIAVLILIGAVVITYHKSYYQKASTITKATMQVFKNTATQKDILIENLPQYNKGAVVFRLGLESGVKWLAPSYKGKIIVLSKDSSDEVPVKNHDNHFKVVNKQYNKKEELRCFNTYLQYNAAKGYIKKDTIPFICNSQQQVLLQFTPTTLKVWQ